MQVYADNAATTKMSAVAIQEMTAYFDKIYGNPSSLHSIGQEAKEALDAAREKVAACLGCEAREVYFTSGGSEADNQAIVSAAHLGARKGKKHIISTAFEHHAVLHTLQKLEKEGYDVTYPVAFDWETIGSSEARTNDMEPSEITNCAGVFCDVVKEAGYDPVIYFNQDLGYLG